MYCDWSVHRWEAGCHMVESTNKKLNVTWYCQIGGSAVQRSIAYSYRRNSGYCYEEEGSGQEGRRQEGSG